jgi:phosphatidate cytidylyltransferase
LSSFPDLLRRLAVAIPGIGLFCAVVLINSDPLTVAFFALVAGLAGWEAVGIIDSGAGRSLKMTGFMVTGLAAASVAAGSRYGIVVPFVPGAVLSILWLARSGKTDARARIAGGAGMTGLVCLGTGLLARHVMAGSDGYLIAVPLLICWIGDSSAYFAGSAFGKHRLIPDVSPSKTVEGLVAGLAGAAAGAVLAGTVFLDIPLWQMILTGVAGGIAAVAGDLLESAVKRDAGVKDSGSLLPGHGGVLDRFDSLLAVAPVTWLLLSVFGYMGGIR